MPCPDCSTLNDDDAQSCKQCGRSLLQAEPALLVASVRLEPSPQLDLPSQAWSIWACVSAVLIGLAWLLLVGSYSRLLPEDVALIFAVFATSVGIVCGQIGLVEGDYIQRNKASFWIAVLSVFMGYILFLFFVVAMFGVLYTLENWQ